jgi:hypothetical protein
MILYREFQSQETKQGRGYNYCVSGHYPSSCFYLEDNKHYQVKISNRFAASEN